eukprot:scaffold64328_cov22-Tisochrysis_lutea.AAC.2
MEQCCVCSASSLSGLVEARSSGLLAIPAIAASVLDAQHRTALTTLSQHTRTHRQGAAFSLPINITSSFDAGVSLL